MKKSRIAHKLLHFNLFYLGLFVFNVFNSTFSNAQNSFYGTTCFNNKFSGRFNTTLSKINSCKDTAHLSVIYSGSVNSKNVFWNDGYIGKDRIIYNSGYYQAAIIEDSSKCADTTDWIYVNVNDTKLYIYSDWTGNNYTFCEGSKINLYTYTTGQNFPKKFKWNTGDTTLSIAPTKSGNYFVLSETTSGCIDTSNQLKITFSAYLNLKIKANSDTIVCYGDSVELECNQLVQGMKWYPYYADTKKVKVVEAGEYYVFAEDPNSKCQYYSNKINVITKKAPIVTICMVTADSATGKNKIIWKNNGEPVIKYAVFREGNIAYQFDNIGEVSNTGGTMEFIDTTSIPKSRAYTYFVGGVDSCGNIAQENKYYTHTTSHLTASLGVSGENNLAWSDYMGIYPINSYSIFRSNNGGKFSLLATVSTNVKSYSDLNPPTGSNRYYIQIEAENNCNNTATNINSNMVAFGILNNTKTSIGNIKLYPNPATDKVNISLPALKLIQSIQIFDLTGKLIKEEKPNQSGVEFTISIADIENGYYQIIIDNEMAMPLVIMH